MKKKIRTLLAILICVCMALSLAACSDGDTGDAQSVKTGTPSASDPDINPGGYKNADTPPVVTPEGVDVTFVASYDELSAALTARRESSVEAGGGYRGSGMTTAADSVEPEAMDDDMSLAPAAEPGKGVDYSDTNVQVEGVDEGDIVKTDGEYIYLLAGTSLVIGSVDDAGGFTPLSETAVFPEGSYTDNHGDDDGTYDFLSVNEYSDDLYILGDRAVIVTNYYMWHDFGGGDEWNYESSELAKVYIYDISSPEAPALIAELSQDGGSLASRMCGGTLYVLSSYYVNEYDGDDPYTYVPCVYDGAERTLIAADSIGILPRTSSEAYTVVCSYDVASADLSDSEAVFGAGTTVYMDGDTLYLACTSYDCEESEPRTESVYTVVDYSYASNTHITSFSITGGGIEYLAYGSVPGYVDSQFSMDEYNGYLRLVTTTDGSSYTTYTDESFDFVNYKWEEPAGSTNALYVLDASLALSGSVTDLAQGERVYSVRFDGDTGYFVTFRNTDPLFAVDLSVPSNPTVLSALKIPGFSDYLHLYSDGLLFGLGCAADEETGWTTGLKLSMFDTSDPANVTEKHTLELESDYSPALYNHKAILVSADKDIIAFPADSGYLVYGYDEATGFNQRASIETEFWGSNSRGLWIGDYFYIVDVDMRVVTVLDLAAFTSVGTVSF